MTIYSTIVVLLDTTKVTKLSPATISVITNGKAGEISTALYELDGASAEEVVRKAAQQICACVAASEMKAGEDYAVRARELFNQITL